MSFEYPNNSGANTGNVGPTPNKDFDYNNVPAYGSSPAVQPTGKNSTLTIVGFVLSILFPLVGLILSIVAFRQAGETGDNKGLAKAGIIVGAVLFALNIVLSFAMFGLMMDSTVNGTMI